MIILLNILQFIAKIFMYVGQGILWVLSIFDIFGITKTLNGSSGKESIAQMATENMPDNSDIPQ